MRKTIVTALVLVALIAPQNRAAAQQGQVTPRGAYVALLSATIIDRMSNLKRGVRDRGRMVLRFGIDRSGIVRDRIVLVSSGSLELDILALRTVPIGFRFPPIPFEFSTPLFTVTVPLRLI